MAMQNGGGGGGSPLSLLQQQYGTIFPAAVLRNLTGTMSDGQIANVTQGLLELNEYVAGYWYTWHHPSFYHQLFTVAAFLGTYFFLGATVFGRRVYNGQVVFFKIAHRPHGRYIVPSVFDCFTASLLVFVLTNVSWVICTYLAYHQRDSRAQNVIRLFEILQWIPLFTAGWMACTGSFLTGGALDGPPQLGTRRATHQGSSRRQFLQDLAIRIRLPTIVNCITLGVPFLMTAGILPWAILSQRAHMYGFGLYKQFHAELIQPLVQQSPLTLDPDMPAVILQRASEVRDAAIRDVRFMSAAFYGWTGGASVVLAVYLPCGGILLYLIWKQVRRQKEVVRSGVGTFKQQGNIMRKNITGVPPTLHRWCVNCGQKMMAARLAPCECGFSVGVASAMDIGSPSADYGDLERNGNTDGVGKDNADLVRMAAAFKGRLVKEQGTPLLRYFYLRRCLLNFTFLYLAIVATTFMVMLAAGIFGYHLVPSMSHGPDHFTKLYVISALLSNWSLLIFGSLATAAIWLRHFDPANDPSYYARAGMTGYAPSTGLSLLGLKTVPKPFQRYFPGLPYDESSTIGDGREKSRSTVQLMTPALTNPYSQSPSKLQRSGRRLKKLGSLGIRSDKFKHVLQEPPEADENWDEGQEETRREVQFGLVNMNDSPLTAADSNTSMAAAPTRPKTPCLTSPTSAVHWTLRRSASAVSMGTSANTGSPAKAHDAVLTPSPSTGALDPSKTPVRYATPFGPIEVTPSYTEPLPESMSADTLSSARPSPFPSPEFSARQGLGLAVALAAGAAGLQQQQQQQQSKPLPGWNDRFTALRRSAVSSRPGTSESAAATPHLSSSSSQPQLQSQSQQQQQTSEARHQRTWSPSHWRSSSFSSGAHQGH
ncbi:unnamed protein product [Tilletia controversa]|uniref:Uncharacterized protein n=3 Tax=Tilletia TaxID=13289 RepID=A0A8X7MP72_9BASI|nr:hypothetical protein CF336_g6022 [Tilletia laevis]KAE8192183.1 hypothetical protein CF328_g5451 [Tilletia controversa]KAE8256736.1 hypothetical protein A4X03_0g5109 [Tilletia caries]KAE8195312.1 hypothetical protein CF335_g5125 [Tilletia laevis]KAE8243571.1 hypothetical protein A4X06_0g6226 [Tilletia controversa]